MKRRLGIVTLLGGLLAAAPASATQLKLATLAPDGSVWHDGLVEMGQAWQKATGGDCALRVYAGGVAGDEPDMVRKMRTGQLQAATLTVSGLSQIDGAFAVLAMPLFYDSYDEFWHVTEALEPTLRRRLEERGFVLIGWGLGGWVHLFSETPVSTVEDLKKIKLFASAGDDKWVELWKGRGFNPVPLAMTDIQTGLQTGLIDGLPTTPLAALSLQWFRLAPFMSDQGLAPLVGATVVTKVAWDRLTAPQQKALVDAAGVLEAKLRREVPQQDAQAVEEMRKRGLTVTPVASDAASRDAWRREADALSAFMRDKVVPAEVFDAAVRARDAFRNGAGSR